MNKEEMEKLADMIAARLMDTFAARLDMIEEVVFSEDISNIISYVDTNKRILQKKILQQFDKRQCFTFLEIACNKDIHDFAIACLKDGFTDGEYSELMWNTVANLCSDGVLVSKKKSNEYVERYYKSNKHQDVF